MLCREVQNYISNKKGLPFFYIIGDADYCRVLEEFKQNNIHIIRISDFCSGYDKFPSVDDLVNHLQTLNTNNNDNKFVIIGLGEFLALKGNDVANKELSRLKNTILGNVRAVLLLRGVQSQAKQIIQNDNKVIGEKRAYISDNSLTNISITNITSDVEVVEKRGMKYLLHALEDGATGTVYANSSLVFDNALFPITRINDAYTLIKSGVKEFELDSGLGTKEQWQQLLRDLHKYNKDLKQVFINYNIRESVIDDLYMAISGDEYYNWLVFIYLKWIVKRLHNFYLKFVIEMTLKFEDFKTNLITAITNLSHKEKNFKNLYNDRKKLLKNFPEEDISVFLKENEKNQEESIYRLTDNTMLEKKTIVKWLVRNGSINETVSDAISYIYPDLHSYLKRYIFDCPVLANELTEYFDFYKRQKVLNYISDNFITLVEKHASCISYAQLPTRDNAIKAVKEKDKTYLYWIDALGVEYMSYITDLAKEMNLSIQVDIVRSDLPTITSVNKQFYEQWKGGKKYKEERLDNIKHKESGGYFFTVDEDPIHIPEELEVIRDALRRATLELRCHNCKSFVIASDHGASRLAVIKKQEVPYDTDTKGEHSGRCCKYFDGCNVPYKIEDNGFIVLSDYGRFRGSRIGNVEVHGGASLEEIVIPIITLKLKKVSPRIDIIQPNDIVSDRHNGVVLRLSISDVETANNIRLKIEDKLYQGEAESGTNYIFRLKDIKRPKTKPYKADAFDGDNKIGTISFKVRGKTAKVKDDFDFGDEY